MSRWGIFLHDGLAHPICAVLWIVGLQRFGDWLHDTTVHPANREAEIWPTVINT